MDYDREFLTGTVGVLILSLLSERHVRLRDPPGSRPSQRQAVPDEGGNALSRAPSDGTLRLPRGNLARRGERTSAKVLCAHAEGPPSRQLQAAAMGVDFRRDARHSR